MSQNNTTRSDVIDTVNRNLSTAEVEESELVGGVRVVVPESEVGQAFGLFRRQGIDFESARDPSTDNLVFNVEAEEESDGLGELFG